MPSIRRTLSKDLYGDQLGHEVVFQKHLWGLRVLVRKPFDDAEHRAVSGTVCVCLCSGKWQ